MSVSSSQFDHLDHLSREFLAQLKRLLSEEAFHPEFTDRLIVTIPARASEVGGLTIWLDGDEITVELGELHHTHFEVPAQLADEPDGRERLAAENAVEYIRDIITDRVRFGVAFEDGRCLASSSWYPESTEGGTYPTRADEVREYVWSRRIK